ncbi:nuclease-related domain-containing protein [Arthrobacter sp. NPDC056493]|uniref:nuclease-related domain-containing protein n=1 Tax=Arthrobacter sp. NPDC056493 TaxID=3345839 RepID=UPI00366C2B94
MGDSELAGEGAAEQARLAGERVAKLRQQLEQAEQTERAWAKGAAGEALVGQVLDGLASQGWLALHDVHWPGRPKANLDHILVGPGGVIVIDAKNWSGEVEVRNGVLRQNGSSRDRAVSAVAEQGAAVAALLEPQHRRLVQAWLCMVDQPDLDSVAGSGVSIRGLARLGRSLEAMPAALDPATVQVIHDYLLGLLSGETSPPLLTTKDWNAGPADLDLASGPAVALESRRSRQHATTAPHNSRRKRTARSRPTGCLAALFYLALAIFVLGLLLNAWPHAQRQPPVAPRPSPSLVQPVPSR